MKVVFAILAILEAIIICGVKDKDERKAHVIAYVATITGIVLLFAIDLAVLLWT